MTSVAGKCRTEFVPTRNKMLDVVEIKEANVSVCIKENKLKL